VSRIADSDYHKFLTGEVVDADSSPTGADLNPLFKVFQAANNDNFDRIQSNKTTADTHIANSGIHVTSGEKSTIASAAAHIADSTIHVTPTDKSNLAAATAHIANGAVHVTSGEKTTISNAATHIANNGIHVTSGEKTTIANAASHIADGNIHTTLSEKNKLAAIEAGAEVNQSAFSKIVVPGQLDVDASSKTDLFRLVAGSGINLTTDPGTNSVTIINTGGGGGGSSGTYVNALDYGAVGDGVVSNNAAFASIRAALGSAGGTVYLPTGIYRITDSVRFVASEGSGPVSIVGDGDGTVILIDNVSESHTKAPLYISGLTGVSYRNFMIKSTVPLLHANRNATQHGFWILDCTDITVDNVSCDGMAATFLLTQRSQKVQVLNCRYNNTLADGIHITDNSKNVTIIGNKGYLTGDDGIAVVSYITDGGYCEDVTIMGNHIYNSKARGIASVGGKRITIALNHVNSTVSSGLLVNKDLNYNTYDNIDVFFFGNTVLNAGQETPKEGVPTGNQFGIEIATGSPGTVCESNIVRNAKTRGISGIGDEISGQSHRITIKSNKIAECGSDGINFQNINGCVIEANRVESCGGYGGWFQSVSGSSFYSNYFYNNNTSATASIDNLNINNSNWCIIVGNVAEDSRSPQLVERGIEIGDSSNCKVGGNNVVQADGVTNVTFATGCSMITRMDTTFTGNGAPTATHYAPGTEYFDISSKKNYKWDGATWRSAQYT